ncbi:Glycosyl hydrolases family 2, TIM barrel domain [Draconibacterium orientale]|jgi:beta-galactosidase/beta-glucuronidase|uniref:Beta-galactosidase n=1 Tax=Draconibacterium orientale TaxID=1168034 RepID=X5DBT7_9BACT|nr:sugar-binding domain-containing protein [Draconibacterium orientale]AHW60263.1 beta-galactosidase [Draconibacterium orientale]SET66892.1 Glycosyl hydrolases family 2, TIM barrel domain [Draconibacterium orientale]
MKQQFIVLIFALSALTSVAQWKPAGNKIKTQWAEKIDVNNVLPEYPRPIMERADWQNLNGLWNYAITEAGQMQPANFDGEILVPFAVESSLSGVQKTVGETKELWYQRTFTVPSAWKGKKVLLHFGAVDWKADVWVNDIKVGSHKGGYDAFSFDVTPFLNKSGEQNLVVKVWDPSDRGYQPRGKQVSRPEGIWYTPVTGIWQTVWLEPVNEKHITDVVAIPNIDNASLKVDASVCGATFGDVYEVVLKDGNNVVSSGKAAAGQSVELPVSNAKLWSPESPFLYDLEVKLISNGKTVDAVDSYTAMRKVSSKRDENGIVRLQLNNKDYFQFGPLDQGWWPDGLYTAPSDEALKYDIQKTKDFGFNMIRKHVKVEPARWYTHCDEMGILVWQDMPNGDRSPRWQNRQYFDGTEMKRSPESEANYRNEWQEIMNEHLSNPSVVCWVPFNEAWGQFKTEEIVEWTKAHDPSRLVNPASGGNHYRVGDMLDLHNYPGPEMYLYDGSRATVLGEYGGIGLALEGHLWATDRNWGYVQFKNSKDVTDKYVEYAEELYKMAKSGFSAAVYTQTTDVEGEVNGLMTYDRKVIKLDENRVRQINQKVCKVLNEK